MSVQGGHDHWFSFRDSYVFVSEKLPAALARPVDRSLFFLHGRFGHGEMWNPLIEDFCSKRRCLTVDFPGFGRSYSVYGRPFSLLEHTGLVLEVVRELTLPDEKVILVGHDIGGSVAQLCALRFPEKVAALILINSAGLTRALEKIRFGFKGCFVRQRLRQLLKQAGAMKPHCKVSLLAPWKNKEARQSLFRAFQALEETWPWHYERMMWKEAIQNINQPVLLLWGSRDTINPPDTGVELMRLIREAYYFLHEESGHWPCLEHPQWVLKKMKEFIFKISSEEAGDVSSDQKSLLR